MFYKIVVGYLQTNCYIISQDKKAIVIDPGAEPEKILSEIKRYGLEVELIISTHGHFDHIEAVKEIVAVTNAEFAIHEKEQFILKDATNRAETVFGLDLGDPQCPDRYLHDCEIIKINTLEIKIIHTPGHTPGSICILYDDMVFTGDTLFDNTIGRTDLNGGSRDEIIKSIKHKLFNLKEETKVYPGHGEATTIGKEKKNNPFVKS